MKNIQDIRNGLIESLANSYLQIISKKSDSTNMPKDEIFGLASKLKKEKLSMTGEADQIAEKAKLIYEIQLKAEHPDLFKEYNNIQNTKSNKDLKRIFFKRLNSIFPDTQIKQDYITTKIQLNKRDLIYIKEACNNIAARRINEEVNNLKKLFISHSGNLKYFVDYLSLINYFDTVSSSILFRKQLLNLIADKYSSNKVRIIFYKCLRLTHDGGNVGFYHLLDDYSGYDKYGNSLKFIAKADIFQLNKIKNIIKTLNEYNLRSDSIVIVSDFDLYKFKGYSPPRDRIAKYVEALSNFFNSQDVLIKSETEFFNENLFELKYKEICESINSGSSKYINHNEFLRIEGDYLNHFSNTMKIWDTDTNHYYSVASVARNIAEGIYLDSEPTIVFAFGDPKVHAERFNLVTKSKIPFLGLEKIKAKYNESDIIQV